MRTQLLKSLDIEKGRIEEALRTKFSMLLKDAFAAYGGAITEYSHDFPFNFPYPNPTVDHLRNIKDWRKEVADAVILIFGEEENLEVNASTLSQAIDDATADPGVIIYTVMKYITNSAHTFLSEK